MLNESERYRVTTHGLKGRKLILPECCLINSVYEDTIAIILIMMHRISIALNLQYSEAFCIRIALKKYDLNLI
jgi:hypothetical protein